MSDMAIYVNYDNRAKVALRSAPPGTDLLGPSR